MSESIDEAEILSRVGGDRELLREVVEIFIDDSPGMLQAIGDAVSRRDAKAIFSSAHKLKGSVVNFSPRGASLALGLERMGTAGELEGAESAFAELEIEIGHIRSALEKLIERRD